MTRVLVATTNAGKLAEFAHALAARSIEVVGLGGLDGLAPVEETGTTFDANARLKAEGYSLRTGLPVLADDSGLEVDALGGEPGVQSARWGDPSLDDAGRCALLLERLKDVPDARRTARFRCVLALARSGRTIATFQGAVDGMIARAPRGVNGFGYDPVFVFRGHTFAEIDRATKQRHSHRGAAIHALVSALERGTIRLTSG